MAGLGDMFGASLAAVNGQKPRNSDRIQAGQPLNLRAAFEAAQNIPVAGDAISGVMAAYDAAKGDYPSAAMNALGVLPFVTAGTVKGVGKAADALSGKKLTEFEQRHLIAQQNAALPVEQGGLGLPVDNTAMDRAGAMGFKDGWYHGTDSDFQAFDQSKVANKYLGSGINLTSDNKLASVYTSRDGGNVMPIMLKMDNPFQAKQYGDVVNEMRGSGWNLSDGEFFDMPAKRFESIANSMGKDGIDYGGKVAIATNPNQLRSRFAAFDPMRRHEADLLGNINPQLAGAMGVTGLGAAYGATQLPDEYKSAIANAFSGR